MTSISKLEPVEPTAGQSRFSLLKRAGASWFFIAAIGQTFFLTYILGFYGPSALTGQFAKWSQHRQVIDGYVAGDLIGNIQFGFHILLAAILTFGGILQVWPMIRKRFKAFHRWNGRVFSVAAILASVGGLWLVWVRGSQINLASAIGISINAILIIVCVGMAVKLAIERQFGEHEQWAMRAFLLVSGVWFLRIGMMAFGLIGTGVFGLPESAMQMFFSVWSFGSYLVPLAIYETYLWARFKGRFAARLIISWLLFAATGVSVVGVAGTVLVMWWPVLRASWGL